ncbi:MAG TPA: winged helix DNA-binding domain-containing protein [Dehalococcoidia bacterium]|nr:winged helix DNA-binding domain-containing protein [Dehalococcoidia bacterium]
MISAIARQRLSNLQIEGSACRTPAELVARLGAVQAQDYAGAKWALGLRLPRATDAAIEAAFGAGAILRTHVLRPTWHFVASDDIRWLLELTAPRVRAALAHYDRQLELGDALYARSNESLTAALAGGRHGTRAELAAALQQSGIDASNGQRMGHLLMRAELDGVICSGARRGKQQTYALLAERAPDARRRERDEALAELTRRYFTGHGPATVKDFVWWSGLTAADARAGIDLAGPGLVCETLDGERYWRSASVPASGPPLSPAAYLLPNYDEYTVGYADRSAVFDAAHTAALGSRENILFHHTVVLDGRVAGTWKRTERKGAVAVTPAFFTPPSEVERKAVAAAAARYGRFLGQPVVLD